MSHEPRSESAISRPIVHQTPIACPTWMITASSAIGTAMKSRTSGSSIGPYTLVRYLLRERGLLAVEPHSRQAVQADGLDQRADVRLGAAQPQRPALRAEPLGQAGEIDHHRGVGEVEFGKVDDDVA